MALDMFFKNSTVEKIVDWLTTNQIRTSIGDLRVFDENNDEVLDELKIIPGQVNSVIFPPNSFSLSPGVPDPNAWVHLRLTNETETNDFAGTPDADLDRWKHSKVVNLSANNAEESIVNGVTEWKKDSGPHDGLILMRGSELAITGLLPHEYLGGNSY